MKARKNYKDTLFRMLFQDKEAMLGLYNAVNGTHYEDAGELLVSTLDNAVYMNMKNDVSFVFDFCLNIFEHQSTKNPNMPLRDLFYVSSMLQGMTEKRNLYGSALVKIPAPRFAVFYNGTANMPERMTYRLSDAYEQRQERPELELSVTVFNINPGMNEELKESCRLLKEYMQYVEKVRARLLQDGLKRAVERAVEECVRENILEEFLRKNRAEAIAVSIFEYDEELHMRAVRAEGKAEGKAEAVIEILENYGTVPQDMKDRIYQACSPREQKAFIIAAARASSIEEFAEAAGLLAEPGELRTGASADFAQENGADGRTGG